MAVSYSHRFLDNGSFDTSNSLVNILETDDDYDDDNGDSYSGLSSLQHSYYCTTNDFAETINVTNGVSILTLNCQSLSAKFDKLILMLKSVDYKIDVICLQETWCIKQSQYELLQFDNYNCVTSCSRVTKHAGLVTYIHKDFNYEEKHVGHQSDIWESQFIEITNEKKLNKRVIICNFYRPPKTLNVHITQFLVEFTAMLEELQKKKTQTYISGLLNEQCSTIIEQ